MSVLDTFRNPPVDTEIIPTTVQPPPSGSGGSDPASLSNPCGGISDVYGNIGYLNCLAIANNLYVGGKQILPSALSAPLWGRAIRTATQVVTGVNNINTGFVQQTTPVMFQSQTLTVVDGGIQIPAHTRGWMACQMNISIDGTQAGIPTVGSIFAMTLALQSSPTVIVTGSSQNIAMLTISQNTFYNNARNFNAFFDASSQNNPVTMFVAAGPSTSTPLTVYNVTIDLFIWIIP